MKKSFGLFILLTAIFISVSVHAEFIEELIYSGELDGISTDSRTVFTSAGYYTGSPHIETYYVERKGPSFTYDGNTLIDPEPTPTAEPTTLPQPPYTDWETTELPGSNNKICQIWMSEFCLINEQGYPINPDNTDHYVAMRRVGSYILVSRFADNHIIYSINEYFTTKSSDKGDLKGVMDFNGNIITPVEKHDFEFSTYDSAYSDNGLMVVNYTVDGQKKYNIVDYRLEPLLEKNYNKINFITTKDNELLIAAFSDNTSIIMDSNLNVISQGNYSHISSSDDGNIFVQDEYGQTYLDSDFKEIFPINQYSAKKCDDMYIVRNHSATNYALGNAEGLIVSEWFDYLRKLTDGRFIAEKDGKNAIMDSNGNVLSQWFDDSISPIGNDGNLYIIGESILINKDGEIINDSYRNIRVYGNNLYLADINGKKAILSSDGKTIICEYDDIFFFESNVYMLVNGLCGVLDSYGQVLIEPKYTSIDYCPSGMENDYFRKLFHHLDGINDFTDFYDKDGNLVFHGEGSVSPSSNKLYITKKTINGEERFAFIDHSGNLMTDFIYTEINPNEYVLADAGGETLCRKVVLNGDVMYLDESFNRYDTDGKVYWFVTNNSNDSTNYCNDLGDVLFSKIDNTAAIIDKRNNSYILPYTVDSGITALGESMVQTIDNKSAILDLYGNPIIQLNFPIKQAGIFQDGAVQVQDTDEYYFYVDEYGNNILPHKYRYICKLDKDTIAAVRNGDLMLLKNHDSPFAANTDMRVFINGFEIPCCSFNGRTLINADDLKGYGFDVTWYEKSRCLSIRRNQEYYNVNPVEILAKDASGDYYAPVIPTDISVEYNSTTLKSYCISNEMFICPEDLTAKGVSYEYNNDARALYISVDGLAQR